MSTTACTIGNHTWDLRYTASAIRVLQMTQGNLTQFVARLLGQSMGAGLDLETQTLLIWAGQTAKEPGLKRKTVRRILQGMADPERYLLVTWAAADCTRTILQMAQVQIDKALPLPAEEDDGE